MSILRGGGTPGVCSCGCASYNTITNCNANNQYGYTRSRPNRDSDGCCSCGNYAAVATHLISNPI